MCLPVVRGLNRESSTPLWQNWLIFSLLLLVLLAANFGYHWLLRELLQVPIQEDELTAKLDALVFITHCIQPAIVEEAYCRGLALGILRGMLGKHGAVWISAIMFGLLHVGAPFSIPYLTLVGVCFGYARLATGGMLLPIALHFAHNLIVLTW